jgi:hypothetical protein
MDLEKGTKAATSKGICVLCEGEIAVGDPITKNGIKGKGWRHVDCPPWLQDFDKKWRKSR